VLSIGQGQELGRPSQRTEAEAGEDFQRVRWHVKTRTI